MSSSNLSMVESYLSLTEVEVTGLSSRYNLTDGHAYHKMPAALQPILADLSGAWDYARSRSVPDMEEEFKNSWARMINSADLAAHPHYSISPTASNSIDIAGAWTAMKGYNAGLLEPVFDNLYLLLKRRGANLTSIQEQDLLDLERLGSSIDRHNLKSLFIVTPNNPTGFHLTPDQYKGICDLCAHKGVALIVDRTFRFYSRNDFDDYKILNASGVDYAVIEDTGKTWPTQDLKVSLMAYSESLSRDMRMLYEEIFLCTSNFTLALLGKIVEKTKEVGVDKVVWQEVMERMRHVEVAVSQTPLVLAYPEKECSMPVVWMDCSATGLSDIQLVRKLQERSLVLLPGRFFYWNSQEQHTSNVRLSLMRPDHVLYRGLEVLSGAFPIGNKGSQPEEKDCRQRLMSLRRDGQVVPTSP